MWRPSPPDDRKPSTAEKMNPLACPQIVRLMNSNTEFRTPLPFHAVRRQDLPGTTQVHTEFYGESVKKVKTNVAAANRQIRRSSELTRKPGRAADNSAADP